MEKSRQLWFLLQKVDRKDLAAHQLLAPDKEKYPFFYLLNWNEELPEEDLRKVALQSISRQNFKFSLDGAEKITLSFHKNEFDENQSFSQDVLIDQFLEKAPFINKLKKTENEEIESEIDYSIQSFDFPISETFAKILVKQAKYSLALEVFEQLCLKFPEKKTYFATQIIEINEKIKNL